MNLSIKKEMKGSRVVKIQLKNARKLSNGSQKWLSRQLNDPYVQQAQSTGLRSRAAFKLIQLDDKYHFLKPGRRVIDLGAAPGSWTQIIVERVNPTYQINRVIGIDLLPIEPVTGSTFIQGDFLEPASQNQLQSLISSPVHCVLSDMASLTIGHTQTDHLRTIALAEAAFSFAKTVLTSGGCFVTKVFQGGTNIELLKQLKESFQDIKHVKPPASRKESPEMYMLAFGFKK